MSYKISKTSKSKNTTQDNSNDTSYSYMNPVEHVYKIPDTYIGSVEPSSEDLFVYDNGKIVMKDITYIQGFYKIFDEILVNALDQYTRTMELKYNKVSKTIVTDKIEITIDKESGYISVMNTGDGFVIEENKVEGKTMYSVEMVCGLLLTSGNYNKKDKIVGGLNGYGLKLTNIFSKEFKVETIDYKSKTKYTQMWYNNMEDKEEPIIEKKCSEEPYTKFTFLPDYERFGMEGGLDDNIINLLVKRVYDGCLWASNNGMLIFNNELKGKTKYKPPPLNIYLNGNQLECNIKSYINMYNTTNNIIDDKQLYIYSGFRWEVCIIESPNDKYNQISMINAITTNRGGKYVDYITNQFTKKCLEYIKTKKKNLKDIKVGHIKDKIWIFVKHIMEDSHFDSQIKSYCTTNIKNNKCEFDDKFIDKFMKNSNIITKLEDLQNFANNKVKTTTNKIKCSINVPKLQDANFAGTKKSNLCTLILTEGDSAMSSAMASLSAIKNGRDIYGVFPLKGKLLNVRDITMSKIESNAEIMNILKIIGLNFKTEYVDTSNLRYNKIMILTDQDVDGFHIKGLLINFIETLFPSLLDLDSFVTSLSTPIVIAKKKKEQIKFYNLGDYQKWCEDTPNSNTYNIKYFKGLGTSNRQESQEYFKDMKLIEYFMDKNSKNDLKMAFQEDLANDRKDWLKSYDKNDVIELENNKHTKISLTNFIHKELKHFSNYDNIRSIPHIIDGLKPSQRKILWSCFKKNLTNEIKVSQLAGYVSEVSEYHHGEMSLLGCIVNMAQNFIGSNNINLLVPQGQFGSRFFGGKDSASPRYIYTNLSPITFKLFNKLDQELLIKQFEDNSEIEPLFYIPVLPNILINGSQGIGTGFSTHILQYNPIDIISNIRKLMKGNELDEMFPYYKNYTGQIVKEDDKKYNSIGKIHLLDNKKNILEITELPIGKWTHDYETFLDKMVLNKQIVSYDKYSTDIEVNFHIKMSDNIVWNDIIHKELINTFKLKNNLNITNMHLFNKDNIITKYNNVNDILEEFYYIRLEYYEKRKNHLLDTYNFDKLILENKIKFITKIIAKKLIISNKPDQELFEELTNKNYHKNKGNFDYLLHMQLRSMTLVKITELKNELDKILGYLDILNNKSIINLYEDDLKDFEKEYMKFLKID